MIQQKDGNKNIEYLNKEVFQDIELTKEEEKSLVWLSGWELDTIRNIVSAFKKLSK